MKIEPVHGMIRYPFGAGDAKEMSLRQLKGEHKVFVLRLGWVEITMNDNEFEQFTQIVAEGWGQNDFPWQVLGEIWAGQDQFQLRKKHYLPVGVYT